MDSYYLNVTASNGTITNATFKISKASGGQWILQNGTSTTCNEKAKKPGVWKIQATATLSPGGSIQSNTVTVTVQYPDVYTIKSNSTVSANMSTVWMQTKNAASSSGYMEKGFAIYVNTTTMAYECGPTISGSIISCGNGGEGEVYISGAELIPSSPVQGGKYYVADFHTHPPLTYCPSTDNRKVGPSSTDISDANVPGILYDYVGQNIPNYGVGIKGGHSLNAASTIYVYGPNRKNTPN
jgi:hypothetical protein